MPKIIKIHGCSGAGKTTAVRSLLELGHGIRVQRAVAPAEGYGKSYGQGAIVTVYDLAIPSLKFPVFVLGNYDGLACGGVDGISDFRHVLMLLDEYAPQGHVVFEGLLQSTYYGKMGEHSLKYGKDYIYAFLDTPAELCVERVKHRRAAAGNKKEFNPQLTLDKHATILHVKEKVQARGHTVATLKHDESMFPQLLELLK